MSDYIRLPRSALTDELWRNPDLGRLFLYLIAQVDENGSTVVNSGEIFRALGIKRQTFRTLMNKLSANHLLTTLPTTNATTIKFDTQEVKPKRQPPKQPPANHLPTTIDAFVDPRFTEAWTLWLDYRKEINNSYKSERSRRIGYEKFLKLSENDPDKALEIVNTTITNGWKGLFPEKNNGTKSNPTIDNATTRKASRDRLRSLASGVLSQSTDKLFSLYNDCGADTDNSQN